MQTEPQIHFKGMAPSQAVEAAIRERIEGLERVHGRITSCHVTVTAPHRQHRKGKVYQVRVHIAVPGHEIAVDRPHELDHAHEDVYVALRDSFDAARRQLEDVARRSSGHRAKAHPETLHGRIARLEPTEGFGFIACDDGREYFFRRESLSSAQQWTSLKSGTSVRFTAHEGEQGPHASAVMPV